MKLLIVLIKELLESFLRNIRIVKSKVQYGKSERDLTELTKDGVLSVPNFLSIDECSGLIKKIDSYLESSDIKVWVDDEGADHRIYFINEIDEEFNSFYENPEIRKILQTYTGSINPAGMLLASKISYKEHNKGSGDGWHRDSPVSHQFKAICYLNDVTEHNGPFQYIKGSHRKSDVIGNYFKRIFSPYQYRFKNDEIDRYKSITNRGGSSILGEAGSLVLVDTKGIHRGKPLVTGDRYVVFCYFWEKKIPKHFENLKQKEH